MLMDLLGSSLEDLFMQAGKKLSLKTVLQVGEQMVERIELLHEKNILHRDIKPDNFLMGVGKHAHVVFIVDFGLSKRFTQDSTSAHMQTNTSPTSRAKN
jgi:serine/threonine protein kinase